MKNKKSYKTLIMYHCKTRNFLDFFFVFLGFNGVPSKIDPRNDMGMEMKKSCVLKLM